MRLRDIFPSSANGEVRGLVRLVAVCIVIGLVAGLGAAGFLVMLEAGSAFFLGYLANYHPAPPGLEQSPSFLEVGSWQEGPSIVRWMFLIVPTVGGLLSGLLIFTCAPEAEGHGTDAAIHAYHFKDGAVRARVPFVKAVSSMITIGSGGSGGREGPIAQIGSGFGSLLGRALNVTPDERRIFMATGMAAGVGAIFHAPLAGALFAAEVLYRDPDFEHEVLVPSFIASIVAHSVFGGIFGFHPVFKTPDYVFNNAAMLLPYLLLALVSAGGAILYVLAFYGTRDLAFERARRIPNHLKPAIGGLLVGVIGFFLPEALGTGYGVIQMCFDDQVLTLPSASHLQTLLPVSLGHLGVSALLLGIIALGKIATTALSIGTGGSGGVFGPAVVIGGALGGATGFVCAQLLPTWNIQPGAFALIGMAGFFAGAANTPVSTIIMVSEMTGSYNLLVPSMMVCILAYVFCRRFTLYREQLPSRLDAPSKTSDMAATILRKMTVDQAITRRADNNLTVVRSDVGFAELLNIFSDSSQECFPVVDDGHLVAVIDAGDIRRFIQAKGVTDLVIAGDVSRPATTVTAQDTLFSALKNLMRAQPVSLVVVDAQDQNRVIGVLSREDVIAAYDSHLVGN